MKKFIFILIFVLSLGVINAQTSPNVKLKTAVQTEQSLTKTASVTSYTYKGLKVYKSSKGSYFIIQKSKKTGNFYKVYVTI